MTEYVHRHSPRHIDFSTYKVRVVKNSRTCRHFARQLEQHCVDYPVLGFDCEWWSIKGPRRKVALLQLASAGGLCILIQLKKFDSDIPVEVRDLLDDPHILKVGVEPLGDGTKLQQDYGLTMQGTVDLQALARRLTIPEPYGLKALAKTVLGLEMEKDFRIAGSNWEKPQLSLRQVEYASRDAIVGLEIFRAFNERMELREIHSFCDVPYNRPKVLKKAPFRKPKQTRREHKKHRQQNHHLRVQQLDAPYYTEF